MKEYNLDVWASLVDQLVKNLPAMKDTWVQALSWEDHLEEGMAIHSSILPGESPWTEEPGGLQYMGLKESDMTQWLSTHMAFSYLAEIFFIA